MFIIKATLKDETRRLSFDSTKFPQYAEIQQKVRSLVVASAIRHFANDQICTAFNLPSTTHTFWVNVLLFPDETVDAKIMFKKHICDATE